MNGMDENERAAWKAYCQAVVAREKHMGDCWNCTAMDECHERKSHTEVIDLLLTAWLKA
jgi:hypothetical protein